MPWFVAVIGLFLGILSIIFGYVFASGRLHVERPDIIDPEVNDVLHQVLGGVVFLTGLATVAYVLVVVIV